VCGKSVTVSCGIWQTGQQNLEKFATKNRAAPDPEFCYPAGSGSEPNQIRITWIRPEPDPDLKLTISHGSRSGVIPYLPSSPCLLNFLVTIITISVWHWLYWTEMTELVSFRIQFCIVMRHLLEWKNALMFYVIVMYIRSVVTGSYPRSGRIWIQTGSRYIGSGWIQIRPRSTKFTGYPVAVLG